MEKIFALYKGETWIWDGTIQELSKKNYQGFWLEPIEEESI